MIIGKVTSCKLDERSKAVLFEKRRCYHMCEYEGKFMSTGIVKRYVVITFSTL